MAEGRGEAEWARASQLCAVIANVHRGSRNDPVFHPEDFDPYRQRQSEDIIIVDASNVYLMREAFTGH